MQGSPRTRAGAHDPAPAEALAARYGAPAHRGRLLVVTGAVLGVVLGTWLVWTAWSHSTPDVRSGLVGYDVVDEHTATGMIEVELADGVDPGSVTCTLRATAADRSTVGELAFSPTGAGRQEHDVRTAREATSVELLGCRTPDQRRLR